MASNAEKLGYPKSGSQAARGEWLAKEVFVRCVDLDNLGGEAAEIALLIAADVIELGIVFGFDITKE